MLRRIFPCEVKAASEGGATRYTAVASTSSQDLHGEFLEAQGVEFAAGAPLLYGHDYWSLTNNIGVVETADPQGEQVICSGLFDDDVPEHTNAIIAAKKALKGRLRNLSVGFWPKLVRTPKGEVVELKSGEFWWGEPGTRYLKWVLQELSFVPVPANPEAQLLSARGLTGPLGKELRAVITKALEEILGRDEIRARLVAAKTAPAPESTPDPIDDLSALLDGEEPAAVIANAASPAAVAEAAAEIVGGELEDELDQLFEEAEPTGAGAGAAQAA